ncbi:hypothetical protein ABKV19_018443 [Rosa sericea]
MEKNGNATSTTTDSSGVCEKLFSAITANPAFQTIRRISSPARDRSPLANLNHAAGKKIIDIQSKPQQSNKSAVIQVPIKFEKKEVLQPASTPNENRGKLSTSHKAAAKIEPEPAQVAQKKVIAIEHITHGQEGKKEKHKTKSESLLAKGGAVGEGQHINATMKVVKAQEVQVKNDGKKPGGVDINDKFSEYITRAKIKIRTMSSKEIPESGQEGIDGGKDVHFSDFIQRAKNKFKSSTSNVGGTGKTVSFKRDQ